MAENDPIVDAEVAALVARYPLPNGVTDAVLNRDDLADALAVSLNTISAWLNDGLPVQQIGRPGRPYRFQLSHCYAWQQERSEVVRQARVRERQSVRTMRKTIEGSGAEPPDGSIPHPNVLARLDHLQAAIDEVLRILRPTGPVEPTDADGGHGRR